MLRAIPFCSCSPGLLCTLLIVFGQDITKVLAYPGEKCQPGSYFNNSDGCNTCLCLSTGITRDSICSMVFCGEPDYLIDENKRRDYEEHLNSDSTEEEYEEYDSEL